MGRRVLTSGATASLSATRLTRWGPSCASSARRPRAARAKEGVYEREASWHEWLNLWQNIFGSRLFNHTGAVNREDVSAHFPLSARVEHERVPSR